MEEILVADAPDRRNPLPALNTGTQFFAQAADMDINTAIEHFQLTAQDLFCQVIPAHYLAGVLEQEVQKGKFNARQCNFFAGS